MTIEIAIAHQLRTVCNVGGATFDKFDLPTNLFSFTFTYDELTMKDKLTLTIKEDLQTSPGSYKFKLKTTDGLYETPIHTINVLIDYVNCYPEQVVQRAEIPESSEDYYGNYTMINDFPRLSLSGLNVTADVSNRFESLSDSLPISNYRVSYVQNEKGQNLTISQFSSNLDLNYKGQLRMTCRDSCDFYIFVEAFNGLHWGCSSEYLVHYQFESEEPKDLITVSSTEVQIDDSSQVYEEQELDFTLKGYDWTYQGPSFLIIQNKDDKASLLVETENAKEGDYRVNLVLK